MKIHSIETGKVRVKQNQMAKSGGLAPKLAKVLFGRDWSGWLPIYAWVIEHPEGIFVVDTGETHKTSVKGYLPKWHPYYALAVDFDVKPEEEIGPQLKQLGIDSAKDVSKVIMTHLHTDHAGGLHHFPNADILISKREYKAASGFGGIVAGYLPHRWPKWLAPTLLTLPKTSFGPFTHSMPLTADGKITLVSTPGHSPGHLSVIAETEDAHYFLAGDTSYTEENMLRLIPDGIGTNQSLDTLQKISAYTRQFPTVYLPSHDPMGAGRLKKGQMAPVVEQRG